MNTTQQEPIPHGVESPFILITKPETCACTYCNSSDTYYKFGGVYSNYYHCNKCDLPFTIKLSNNK